MRRLGMVYIDRCNVCDAMPNAIQQSDVGSVNDVLISTNASPESLI